MNNNTTKRGQCVCINVEALERYLFGNSGVNIKHIEYDHTTDQIKIFIKGIGPSIFEGQTHPISDLDTVLRDIKRKIEECRLDQED